MDGVDSLPLSFVILANIRTKLHSNFVNMDIKFKSNTLPVQDVDTSKGIVVLYASAFGNVDSDGDVIEQGAFSKSINEWGPNGKNRIKHLWQHNTREPIGTPVLMNEDMKGLRVESKVSSIRNGDFIKLYADGVITEHSIGFEIMKSSNARKDARVITETRLWEYSSVTWGANENTPVVGMKSMTKAEKLNVLNERFDTLIKAITKGSYTDETFQLLAIDLAVVKNELNALLNEQPEPSTETNEPQFKLEADIFTNIYKLI
jgi:HK97 family phage prohead protease